MKSSILTALVRGYPFGLNHVRQETICNHLAKLILPIIFLFTCSSLFAQQQSLRTVLNNRIEIDPESSIGSGSVCTDAIDLNQIPINADGYFHFTLTGLKETDNVSLSLENATGSTFYKMQFSNDEAMLTDHLGTSYQVSTNARNNSLYKIKKCGNVIIWSDNSNGPMLTSTLSGNEVLYAKVNATTTAGVSLDVVFDTDSENCEKCAAMGGQSLFPGDIMFAGYSNESGGNQIVLKNLTPISGGTSFSLVQGSYTASNNQWYSSSNSGNIAIQKITYTGTSTIPAGSTICFTLPTSGTGDGLLANNFSIGGSPTNDFCVENVGNTVNPQINLSSGNSSALFLAQGNWKLLDAHGEFFGRVLSGLQYGGNWKINGQSPLGGLSNIPNDLECMAIEDGLSPALRYAYYTGTNPTVATTTNFGNWQTGNGNLPSVACNSTPSLVENQSRSTNISITKNVAHIYPNPFKNNFIIQLDLVKAQSVKIDVFDSSGRIVHHQTFLEMDAGINQVPVNFLNGTSDLVFWTRIQLADEIVVKRIIKQGTGLN